MTPARKDFCISNAILPCSTPSCLWFALRVSQRPLYTPVLTSQVKSSFRKVSAFFQSAIHKLHLASVRQKK